MIACSVQVPESQRNQVRGWSVLGSGDEHSRLRVAQSPRLHNNRTLSNDPLCIACVSNKQINHNGCTGGVHTDLASCCVAGTIGDDHTTAIGYVEDTTDCVAIAIWTGGSFANATGGSFASGCEATGRAAAFPRKFCDCSSRWRQTRCCRICCGRPGG